MWNFTKEYHLFIVILVIVLTGVIHVNCVSKNESAAKMLSDQLMRNYGSPSIRPVKNNADTVAVSFRVLISQVIAFDERKQHVQINGWRREDWRDEFLQWVPDDYDGLETITYNKDAIWKPDIALIENVNTDYISEFDADVILSYDGNITWFTPIITTSACMVGVRYFPFDFQNCQMTYMSWAYDSSGIELTLPTNEDANQDIFLQNGVWSLRGVSGEERNVTFACCEIPYSQIIYSLTLERAYGFYVLNIVLPSGLLAFVNCLVFLLPPESGERLQFAVANLLAAILFQQLIGGIMPPLGDELPLLGMFFVYMILTNCFVLATSILILRFYHQKGDKVVPGFLRKICFLKRAKEKLLKRHSNLKNSVFSVQEPHPDFLGEIRMDSQQTSSSSKNGESLRLHSDSRIADVNDVHCEPTNQASAWQRRTSISTCSMLERNKNDWQQVARILDYYLFLFIVFITTTVVVVIVILFCIQ
ncbi:neuronal acetylcholine receptor subunit alpha-9-like isoform X1 [Lytechinus pictus]|uniref:neuronal acetylcholine receptor subunit alpha-9-like isoform X1 n=1 Tax=Lytechinus pictus TaxID=7653 RepID=UPI0030B9B957